MIHEQEFTRKKFGRVKCPECQALSKVTSQHNNCQLRLCHNGHSFMYDPESENILKGN